MPYPTHRGSRVGSRPRIQERCGLLVYIDVMVGLVLVLGVFGGLVRNIVLRGLRLSLY